MLSRPPRKRSVKAPRWIHKGGLETLNSSTLRLPPEASLHTMTPQEPHLQRPCTYSVHTYRDLPTDPEQWPKFHTHVVSERPTPFRGSLDTLVLWTPQDAPSPQTCSFQESGLWVTPLIPQRPLTVCTAPPEPPALLIPTRYPF